MFPIQDTRTEGKSRTKKIKPPRLLEVKKRHVPKKKVHDPLSDWKSAWFITLNTNQNNPGLIEPLYVVWQWVVDHIQSFIYGRGYYTGHKETDRAIEQGSRFKRIHMHTKLEISTKGIAFLDFVKINEFINRQLRQIPSFKGVYFNARLIKNYNQALLIAQYTAKAPLYFPRQRTAFQII